VEILRNSKSNFIDLTEEEPASQGPSIRVGGRSPHANLSRTCPYGHTFFPRSPGQNCPFCFDLLRQYRDFANRHGGTLVSQSVSTVLRFRCHRKGHPEFIIPISSLNNQRYSHWCPECNPDSRSSQRKRLKPNPQFANVTPVDPSRSRGMLEEGKKEQARLLSSAKLLYNLTKSSKHAPPPSLSSKARDEAYQDSIRYPEVPPQQSLVVRAILLSQIEEAKPHAWNFLAQCLEVSPEDTTREKLYRMAAKLVHPDKCQHPSADEAFKCLLEIFNKN
jgi:hypothetical protein